MTAQKCVISDHVNHDLNALYAFLRKFLRHTKDYKNALISMMVLTQYKNYKKFTNIVRLSTCC